MGILNINSDSFFEGSRVDTPEMAVERARKMLEEGAAIIDVGAMSSRPGAPLLDTSAEWQMLEAVILPLLNLEGILVSVDTVWSKTAHKALEAGVHIINDISASSIDESMMDTVASFPDVPYIMMHMKGTPETMQSQTDYKHLMMDLMGYFARKLRQASALGIRDVVIDPGFGFAKTKEQSFEILSKLPQLSIFDKAILAGLSRKSMLYKTLNVNQNEALNATTAANTIALVNGARILRVHDVKQAVEAVKIFEMTYA